MGRRKRTPQQKAEKKRRRELYQTVFRDGRQVRVWREQMIDGMPQDEWIRANADLIWLHQEGMWDVIYERQVEEERCLPMLEQPTHEPAEQLEYIVRRLHQLDEQMLCLRNLLNRVLDRLEIKPDRPAPQPERSAEQVDASTASHGDARYDWSDDEIPF